MASLNNYVMEVRSRSCLLLANKGKGSPSGMHSFTAHNAPESINAVCTPFLYSLSLSLLCNNSIPDSFTII